MENLVALNNMNGNLFRFIRRAVFQIALIQPFNWLGRTFFKLLPISISARKAYVFPVKGELKINYGRFGSFKMINRGADTIASRAYFMGALSYEAATAKCLSALFLDSKCFYDVGANTGICTLMAGKHPGLKEIHAFEPVSYIASHLERNIERNGVAHAKAHRAALSRQSGPLKFQISHNPIVLPLGSSELGSTKGFGESGVDVVSVEGIALDDFVARSGAAPDVIKIDTEATEAEVIGGGAQTIRTYRPSLVVEVLNEKVGNDIQEFFKDLNYEFLFLTDEGHFPVSRIGPDPGGQYLNYALIPRERVTRYRENLKLINEI